MLAALPRAQGAALESTASGETGSGEEAQARGPERPPVSSQDCGERPGSRGWGSGPRNRHRHRGTPGRAGGGKVGEATGAHRRRLLRAPFPLPGARCLGRSSKGPRAPSLCLLGPSGRAGPPERKRRGLVPGPPVLLPQSSALGRPSPFRTALPWPVEGRRAGPQMRAEGRAPPVAGQPCPNSPVLRRVSKATWGDVVTAVGCWGGGSGKRGGARMGSGSVELSVTP